MSPEVAPSPDAVRYAVVGLGWIAQAAILPGFRNALSNSRLVALVSDDQDKLRELSKEYDVPRTYTQDEYDACLRSGEIDAVYLAVPNHVHREYAERAARAGIHVLCEKPMAVTEADCRRMVAVSKKAGVRLMVAYRLHFERANLEAIEIVRSGRIGEPRIFHSVLSQLIAPGNGRLKADQGNDAALLDLGIYCLNAARYMFADEPTEVTAVVTKGRDPRFAEVGEMTSVILRFPRDRVATFTCSFGASAQDFYEVVGTEGRLHVEPAYEFRGKLRHTLTVGEHSRTKTFPRSDQFGPEVAYFSDCILKGRPPEPDGIEGLEDIHIIEAIHLSIASRSSVALNPIPPRRRPGIHQYIQRAPVPEPKLVHVTPP